MFKISAEKGPVNLFVFLRFYDVNLRNTSEDILYSIIDIEGNGAPFRKESIIEIAVFRFDGHRITDRFLSLVNPESEITPFVQKLTRITPKMVKTAPKFHEIAKRIIEITENTVLVGHNIEFDYRMLRQSFKRLGYDFTINTLDTIPLAKKLIPDENSYSLGKLCKSLGIPLLHEHRAHADALATLELFKLLKTKDNSREIIQQHHEESNAHSYIHKIRDLTEDLPSEKGFLYFQNSEGTILFEDYVDDLYKVARKIFNSKSQRWHSLQQEVAQLTYELTGTDTIAKLMLANQGKTKKTALPFGLFFREQSLIVDKTSRQSQKPLLRFKSFSQAQRVKQYLSQEHFFESPETLESAIALKGRNELWIGSGRVLGEKSFLMLEEGQLTGFGYFELHHQIKTRAMLQNLMIKVSHLPAEILNDLKLSLLKKEYEIRPLPEK